MRTYNYMALTENQINTVFQSKVGRAPTPEEAQKFSNASFDKLSQLDKVNFSTYGTPTPENNTPQVDVSTAVLPTQTPQNNQIQQNPNAPLAPTPEGDAHTAATIIENQTKANLDQKQSDYTGYQRQVQAIDKALSDSYTNKKKEIEAQGGIVNETQLRAQVANEQAPLLSQRKTLAVSQAEAGKILNKSQTEHQQQVLQSQRLQQQAQISGARLAQSGSQFQQRQGQQLGEFNDKQGQQAGQFEQKLGQTADLAENKNAIAIANKVIDSAQKGTIDLSKLDPKQLAQIEKQAGLPDGYLEHLHKMTKITGTKGGVSGGGKGGSGYGGLLSLAALDKAADVLAKTGALPTGFSRDKATVASVWNRFADKQKETNGTVDIATAKASYDANKKALTQLVNQTVSKKSYEDGIVAQIPIMIKLSDSVDRGNSPLYNSYQQAITQRVSGDSNLQQFHNSVETFVNEYAKVMAGGTGSSVASSDSARKEAQSLLTTAFNKGTFKDSVALLKKEMDFRIGANEKSISDLQARISGNTQPEATPKVYTPKEIPTGYYQASDGKLYKK